MTITVTARAKHAESKKVEFDCVCTKQEGKVVIEGKAEVIAPVEHVERPRAVLPNVRLAERGRLRELFDAADPWTRLPPPLSTPAMSTLCVARWRRPRPD